MACSNPSTPSLLKLTSCEQVWEGGRSKRSLSQNGYGVPKFWKFRNREYSAEEHVPEFWKFRNREYPAEEHAPKFWKFRNREYSVEEHEFRIIQNSLNTVQASPRFHSEKAPSTAQACSLDLFLREISRAPFRGNKWLSSLELAARRAKLIGKTHVRTPQVRRLLPKREVVRKGSEKTAKSACPRRHAAPTP